jgi:hypothetical protein
VSKPSEDQRCSLKFLVLHSETETVIVPYSFCFLVLPALLFFPILLLGFVGVSRHLQRVLASPPPRTSGRRSLYCKSVLIEKTTLIQPASKEPTVLFNTTATLAELSFFFSRPFFLYCAYCCHINRNTLLVSIASWTPGKRRRGSQSPIMRLTSSAATLVAGFVAQAQAQYLVNDLSFGYGVRYGSSFTKGEMQNADPGARNPTG